MREEKGNADFYGIICGENRGSVTFMDMGEEGRNSDMEVNKLIAAKGRGSSKQGK